MLTIGRRFPQSFALILALTSSMVEAAEAEKVLGQLRQIAKEEIASSELLLARAASVVSEAYQGKAWIEVESALKSSGANVTESGGDGSEYKCVILPVAWPGSHNGFVRLPKRAGRTIGADLRGPSRHDRVRSDSWTVGIALDAV